MKFKITLFFCLVAAVICGYFLGEVFASSSIAAISWLGKVFTFGFETTSFDLRIIRLNLGLHIDINVMQLLFLILAIAIASKIAASIKTS